MPLPYRVVLLQIAVGVVVAGGLWFWRSTEALAAMLATAVSAVPNGLFAWRAVEERSASRLLGAGVLKFLGTIGLMVLVIWLWKPAPVGFFSVLVLMQVVHAMAALQRQ